MSRDHSLGKREAQIQPSTGVPLIAHPLAAGREEEEALCRWNPRPLILHMHRRFLPHTSQAHAKPHTRGGIDQRIGKMHKCIENWYSGEGKRKAPPEDEPEALAYVWELEAVQKGAKAGVAGTVRLLRRKGLSWKPNSPSPIR